MAAVEKTPAQKLADALADPQATQAALMDGFKQAFPAGQDPAATLAKLEETLKLAEQNKIISAEQHTAITKAITDNKDNAEKFAQEIARIRATLKPPSADADGASPGAMSDLGSKLDGMGPLGMLLKLIVCMFNPAMAKQLGVGGPAAASPAAAAPAVAPASAAPAGARPPADNGQPAADNDNTSADDADADADADTDEPGFVATDDQLKRLAGPKATIVPVNQTVALLKGSDGAYHEVAGDYLAIVRNPNGKYDVYAQDSETTGPDSMALFADVEPADIAGLIKDPAKNPFMMQVAKMEVTQPAGGAPAPAIQAATADQKQTNQYLATANMA